MAKFSLGLVSLLVLSVYGRPDNYQLNQQQITQYRSIGEEWKNVINFNKKPCDEFYNYVCTDFNYPSYPTEEEINLPIGDYFEHFLASYPQKISEVEQKFVKYQQTCKVISQPDRIQWIKKFNFPDTIGGWPAYTPNWTANNFHLQAAIAELTSYNQPVVFEQEFETDPQTFKNYYVITKEDVYDVNGHQEFLQERLTLYGVINPQEIVQDALQYQKAYNDAIASVQKASDIKTDYAGLKKLVPEIDWDHQVSYVYGGVLPNDYPVVVKSEEEIIAAWNAISKLSPRVIANYFFIKFFTFEGQVDYEYFSLFNPVLTGVVKKYILNEPLKQELKGILYSVLEVFQQAFGIFGTGDVEPKIQSFVNEQIFGPVNDVALNQEYQTIATVTTPVECLTSFHYLQQLYTKRVAKQYFNEQKGNLYHLQREIDNVLLSEVPKYIQYPSAFIYKSLVWELVSTVVYWYKVPYGYTLAQKQCFSHQLNYEVSDDQLTHILINQIFTKGYFQWIKDYPDVVQVENNIFKDYELSSQKLLTMWFTKQACTVKTPNDALVVFWNLPEFADYYQCTPGSKMNPVEKCSFW